MHVYENPRISEVSETNPSGLTNNHPTIEVTGRSHFLPIPRKEPDFMSLYIVNHVTVTRLADAWTIRCIGVARKMDGKCMQFDKNVFTGTDEIQTLVINMLTQASIKI